MYKANLYLLHMMYFLLLLKFADGSPCSRVCASNTLRLAPIDASQQMYLQIIFLKLSSSDPEKENPDMFFSSPNIIFVN